MRVFFDNMAQFTQVRASVGVYCGTDFVGLDVFSSRGSDNQICRSCIQSSWFKSAHDAKTRLKQYPKRI